LTLAYRILVDGLSLSAAAIVLILASIKFNPRLWLQDLPKDIRDAVPPKTAAEKRWSLIWAVPFLAVLVGVPLLSCLTLRRQAGGAETFGLLWLDAFGVAMMFNLFDLVLVDWLIVCTLTPRFIVIPGTAGLPGYKDFGHHARGFVVGTFVSAATALVCAAIARLI